MGLIPGVTPRYPKISQQGWYAGWVPNGIPVPIGFAPVPFTSADNTVSVTWPNPATEPHLMAYVQNPLSGVLEPTTVGFSVDKSNPLAPKYIFHNVGGEGYIALGGVANPYSIIQLENVLSP